MIQQDGQLMLLLMMMLMMMLRQGVGASSIFLVPTGQNSDQRSRNPLLTYDRATIGVRRSWIAPANGDHRSLHRSRQWRSWIAPANGDHRSLHRSSTVVLVER